MDNRIVVLIGSLIAVYVMYLQNEYMWYSQIKKGCKRYKGICNKCNNWSCIRKEMLEKREVEIHDNQNK